MLLGLSTVLLAHGKQDGSNPRHAGASQGIKSQLKHALWEPKRLLHLPVVPVTMTILWYWVDSFEFTWVLTSKRTTSSSPLTQLKSRSKTQRASMTTQKILISYTHRAGIPKNQLYGVLNYDSWIQSHQVSHVKSRTDKEWDSNLEWRHLCGPGWNWQSWTLEPFWTSLTSWSSLPHNVCRNKPPSA